MPLSTLVERMFYASDKTICCVNLRVGWFMTCPWHQRLHCKFRREQLERELATGEACMTLVVWTGQPYGSETDLYN